jgi:hypothetical protein
MSVNAVVEAACVVGLVHRLANLLQTSEQVLKHVRLRFFQIRGFIGISNDVKQATLWTA